jgi:hypothetical protein
MYLHVDVNECVGFGCGYILYYVNLLCIFYNSSCDGCILFLQKKLNQANLRQLGLVTRRLACVIYEDQLDHRRLTCVIYDGPTPVVIG